MNPKISLKVASLGLVSLFAACSNGEAAPALSNSTAPQSCADQTASLTKWLQQLAAEGRNFIAAKQDMPGESLALVKLAAAPAPVGDGVLVRIGPDSVVFNGLSLGSPKDSSGLLPLAENLANNIPKDATEFQYFIDGRVPWSTVASLVDAVAADRGVTSTPPPARVSFVFISGKPGTAAAPGPSAIDAEIAKIESDAQHPNLATFAKDGGLPGKVFKECPLVMNDLAPKLSEANNDKDWSALVVSGLPKAISACGCKVEMASVHRLMWSWWGRDLGTYTAVSAVIAKNGAKVTAKPDATWADVYPKLVEAAKHSKSLTLQ